MVFRFHEEMGLITGHLEFAKQLDQNGYLLLKTVQYYKTALILFTLPNHEERPRYRKW